MAVSFDIWVLGPPDGSAEPRRLYEHPLGGHSTVMDYWVGPAQRLGLPILSRLDAGFLEVEHDELAAFSRELDLLAVHWSGTVPEDVTIPGNRMSGTPLRTHLLFRLSRLREAIRIAESNGGSISI